MSKHRRILTKRNIKTRTEVEREREVATARADVLRRAAAQGVKPFTALADFAGDPELTADFDVDEFLRQVRADRDRLANRSVE